MMYVQGAISRRDLILGWGGGTLAAMLAGRGIAVGQPILLPTAGLTVGDVELKRVIVKLVNMGSPNLAMDKGLCKLLSGGINFRATVELASRADTHAAWWGQLLLVQQVQFQHQHTLAKSGKRECASSGGRWNLDGQNPYQNKRVHCVKGSNFITHADDPGTFAEDKLKGPFEEVDVKPEDKFRTYVIWETTDNSKPPSTTNLVHRHVLARVDWIWSAVALDPPSSNHPTPCASVAFPPNAWNTQAATSDVQVFLGKAALADPQQPKKPVAPLPSAQLPSAMPEAWRPGVC